MCGIVGYIGHREAYPIILKGLKRLEYRGYDSAGIALYDGSDIKLSKTKGKVADLEARLEKAIAVYQEQRTEIAILKEQQNNEAELVGKPADDLKDVPHQSYRTVDRVMYAMAKLTNLDNTEPYSQNNPSLNASITTLLQNDGLTLEYQAVGKWLSRINDIKPLK